MAGSIPTPVDTQASEQGAGSLPLFFKEPVPLDSRRHAKAGLVSSNDLSFASATNSILINAAEFAEAVKHYPVVFTQTDMTVPAVVLGLEQQNYFVDAKGQWKEGAYIPAYVRRYPFVFMDMPERKEFLLCIDEASPQYRAQGGNGSQPLYDSDQKPSELTRNALEFCTAFQNHYQFTRNFCEALKDAGLLTPMRSNAKLAGGGRQIHLGGFQTIDEKKVASLPDATVLDFHRKGWMALIYFTLMSASHWKKLAGMAAARNDSKLT